MKVIIFILKWNGAIRYNFIIHEVKSIVNNEFLVITDGKENNLYLEMHYINNVEIDDRCMILEMENEIIIKIDY